MTNFGLVFNNSLSDYYAFQSKSKRLIIGGGQLPDSLIEPSQVL